MYKLRITTLFIIFCLLLNAMPILAQETSSDYVKKGWALKGKKEYDQIIVLTDECIAMFSQEADKLASELVTFPPKGEEGRYQVMSDVALCYFIKAEALRAQGKANQAIDAFQTIIDKYPYAQAFDPRGWYWSLKEKAEMAIKQLEQGFVEEEEEEQELVTIATVKLYDAGTEFPVNYKKYGKFIGVGSKSYEYIIEDPVGLSRAVGEGVYPNSTSVKFDPEFVKIKKDLYKIDHWEIFNTRDLKTAFYKWTLAPESPGIKQFFIAEILEKSGLLEQAIKSYYAILVHFPKSYGWTYWNTPWYVSKAAMYRLRYLLRNNPKLGLDLKDASIEVINGYDNDVRNDIFIVNPGRLVKKPFWRKICFVRKFYGVCDQIKRRLTTIVDTRGGDRVKLVKYEDGDWQMLVDNKPFMVKGITYTPTRVGESPDDDSLQNWTTQDINRNGLIDSPYESWVDKNKNNIQDSDEVVVGDFQLMKEMGANCIRLYHQPFDLNKDLLRDLHSRYGIYTIMGDFLGKYTFGSGAGWEEGTDYDNPEHKENMLKSIEKMVMEFKDESFVLFWLLGNENVYGLGCNADKKPASFFSFANEAALLIKSLDPQKRPVAIASGDIIYLDIFAEEAPDIDIFGMNAYRGKYGFLDLWEEIKRVADRPAISTEFGVPAYGKGYTQEEADSYHDDYHRSAWVDIMCNSAGYGSGNAIGGIIFEWLDEWWKAYEPSRHDKERLSAGPFLDGYYYEEWFGISGQGDGTESPFLRQLRKAYFTYKKLWNRK